MNFILGLFGLLVLMALSFLFGAVACMLSVHEKIKEQFGAERAN